MADKPSKAPELIEDEKTLDEASGGYELKNVLVSSYQVGGAGQSENVPTEEISLNFEEIKVTYKR